MRVPRTLAVASIIVASVSWGATASAAPQRDKAPDRPILIAHTMSSCGNMDGF